MKYCKIIKETQINAGKVRADLLSPITLKISKPLAI